MEYDGTVPFDQRLELIIEIVKVCLPNNNFCGKPSESLWYLLSRIYHNEIPSRHFFESHRITAVQYLKKNRPDLYEAALTWIRMPTKND